MHKLVKEFVKHYGLERRYSESSPRLSGYHLGKAIKLLDKLGGDINHPAIIKQLKAKGWR